MQTLYRNVLQIHIEIVLLLEQVNGPILDSNEQKGEDEDIGEAHIKHKHVLLHFYFVLYIFCQNPFSLLKKYIQKG